jgi:hypothetical protein
VQFCIAFPVVKLRFFHNLELVVFQALNQSMGYRNAYPLQVPNHQIHLRGLLGAINKALENWNHKPKLDFIDHYYTDKSYIQSLALSVVEHQEQHGKPDKLMIS